MSGVKGRSGRLPKPTNLLVLQGTVRKKRHLEKRKGEPRPTGDGRLPPPPAYLAPEVRDAWLQLASTLKFRIFSEEDVSSFHAFAEIWAQWTKLSKHVRENGVSAESEGKDGRITVKMSPEASMWSDLNGKLPTYFSRFGMTPSDRTRVREIGGSADGAQENPDDEFGKK